jgi:hypothetical protein
MVTGGGKDPPPEFFICHYKLAPKGQYFLHWEGTISEQRRKERD